MYEMRAEFTPERSETLWHVLAKRQTTTTLCGYVLPQASTVTALISEGTAERYCARCMAAFRSTVGQGADPAAEAGRESAAAV
ncbi:hypothetical protein ACF059_13230 [Streptomyces sp. NPDC016562]|uniref:hypothetical protein n=1 Tax=Streptomyces sp. NPDC016562 TaxID=3364966 RepID=UPI003701FFB9